MNLNPNPMKAPGAVSLAAVIVGLVSICIPDSVRAGPVPQVASANPQASQDPQVTVRARAAKPASFNMRAVAPVGSASPVKKCGLGELTYRVIRLTAIEGGARVDYEYVVSGRATWTNMNRPLLKQFGVRAGGTFCVPRSALMGDADGDIDYE